MRMTTIGCGHLGATHAACMASIGHDVLGVDIDDDKVGLLNSGKAWFHEPGLDELLAENIQAGRLRFTTSFADAAEFADVHFVGVATPGQADGSYDLSQLHAVVSSLVPHLRGESLREGFAVQDTLRPDRIVAGALSAAAAETIREIYRPLTEAGVPLLITDLATSELVKGAANAFLATKVSFINAMADICAAIGGDTSVLASALGMDPRIGPAFLKAGLGYGGACLPKDVRGLGTFARRLGVPNADSLLAAVDAINSARQGQVVSLVREALGTLTGKRVAVWGAAFKAGTDDVRDSVALRIADQLHGLGATVTVYDPMATGNALVASPELAYADSAVGAAVDADALVVVTAWPEFTQASPAAVGGVVARTVVIDSCQGIAVRAWRQAGWNVFSLTGTGAGQFLEHATSGPLEMPVRPASRPRAPSGHDRH
jgi:UDPglucose 6-dehydrogenase